MHLPINLATRSYYNRKRVRSIVSILLAVFFIFTSIGIYRFFNARVDSRHLATEISSLEKQLSSQPIGVSEHAYKLHIQQLTTLNELLDRRQRSQLSLLNDLEATLPVGATLTQITPDSKNRLVKLEGQVRSLTILSNLLELLAKTSCFSNPILIKSENTASPQNHLKFSISVEWRGP